MPSSNDTQTYCHRSHQLQGIQQLLDHVLSCPATVLSNLKDLDKVQIEIPHLNLVEPPEKNQFEGPVTTKISLTALKEKLFKFTLHAFTV